MGMAGIILAAGRSTRMGAVKPLLDIDGQPMLLQEVELFRCCGIEQIVVVTGHRAPEVGRLLDHRDPQVQTVYNARFRDDMFTSVCAGVRAVHADMDGVFVLPCDCPGVSPRTLLTMMNCFQHGGGEILYPLYGDRRGHPPLIPAALLPPLLEWRGGGGLKAFLHQYPARHVPIHDRHVLNDLDTAEQYAGYLVAAHENAQ